MAGNFRFNSTNAQTLDALQRYVLDNFRRISDAFVTVESPTIPSLISEPEFPVEGQLAIADGTGWNPGSGAGTYVYRNAQWRKLD